MVFLENCLTEALFCINLIRPWLKEGPTKQQQLISAWKSCFPTSTAKDISDILVTLKELNVLSISKRKNIKFLIQDLSQDIFLLSQALKSLKSKQKTISVTVRSMPATFQVGNNQLSWTITLPQKATISHVEYGYVICARNQTTLDHLRALTPLPEHVCKQFKNQRTVTIHDVDLILPSNSSAIQVTFFWDIGGTWISHNLSIQLPTVEDEHAFRLLAPKAPYVPRTNQKRLKKTIVELPPPAEGNGTKRAKKRGVVEFQSKKKFTHPEWKEALTNLTYIDDFSSALHLEKFQLDKDLDIYQMEAATFLGTDDPCIFQLNIPGLAQKRPSLMAFDCVYVSTPASPDVEFGGRIVEVLRTSILVRFKNFKPPELCSVRFECNQPALKRMLTVLTYLQSDLAEQLWARLLPQKTDHESNPLPNIEPIQSRLNENQKHAVQNVLALNPTRKSPYVIFGPPGTGKTHTVTECILQILNRDSDARVLVCTASNAAADVIAARLVDNKPDISLLRLLAISRNVSLHRNPELHTSEYVKIKDFCSIEFSSKANVVVSTCSSAWSIDNAKFDYLFVDEAGQAMEPEILIPLAIALERNPNLQVIVAGDPKQLGPVIRCNLPRNPLKISLLERLTNMEIYSRQQENDALLQFQYFDPVYITKLVENYRSHASILCKPSEMFYNGDLIPRMNLFPFQNWPGLQNPNIPIVFHSVEGIEEREGKSPSYFNRIEAIKVLQQLVQICEWPDRMSNMSVGIITPYHQQKMKIRELFDDSLAKYPCLQNISEFHVGSVEEFQGNERDVIIISTVRSKADPSLRVLTDLGFLVCPNRLNVSITRPRHLLVFVGNAGLLSLDENWRTVINYCKDNNCVIGDILQYDSQLQANQDLPPEDFGGHNAEL